MPARWKVVPLRLILQCNMHMAGMRDAVSGNVSPAAVRPGFPRLVC
jgi:hypothetical protein